jgi:hypothetical protein
MHNDEERIGVGYPHSFNIDLSAFDRSRGFSDSLAKTTDN